MPINIFQGFTVKERGLCKYSPLGQDLGATLVIIFIDDLDDKLDGVFAKFVDYIKWLMVYVPWWGRIHTDFDKLHKCSKNWGNETKTKASKSATLRKCNENQIFKNNVCIKALEQQNTSVLSQVTQSKTDIGNLKKNTRGQMRLCTELAGQGFVREKAIYLSLQLCERRCLWADSPSLEEQDAWAAKQSGGYELI